MSSHLSSPPNIQQGLWEQDKIRVPSLSLEFRRVAELVVVVQLLSCVWLFVTPWTAAHQASLSVIISWSLLKLMSIDSMMPSNHVIPCCPLLPLPSMFPSIRIFSNESALYIRWPKYWNFSFFFKAHKMLKAGNGDKSCFLESLYDMRDSGVIPCLEFYPQRFAGAPIPHVNHHILRRAHVRWAWLILWLGPSRRALGSPRTAEGELGSKEPGGPQRHVTPSDPAPVWPR